MRNIRHPIVVLALLATAALAAADDTATATELLPKLHQSNQTPGRGTRGWRDGRELAGDRVDGVLPQLR